MAPSTWDAVVVGAGPAGAATAARLAALGHRVLVLDRDRFPRPKPCGECVSPAALQALAELGALERVRAAAHSPIRGWRIVPGAAEPFTGAFPAARAGMGITRAQLDQALLDHARARGAEVRQRAQVTEVVRSGGRAVGVRLAGSGEEIRARLVVGADGLRSVVVRRLGLLRRPPRLRKVALTAHVRDVTGLDGWGELHVFAWGCVGLAAVGDGECNVTVVLPDAGAGRVAGARESYFDGVLRSLDRLSGSRRVGAVLATGPFDWPTRSAVADGALLVGDAAGYYDPFTGQGIFRALHGASLAARTADAALRAGDTSLARLLPYERARRRAFGPGERVQHAIEAVVARPRWLRAAAAHLRRHPALADAVVAVTSDLSPVRSLLYPRGIPG